MAWFAAQNEKPKQVPFDFAQGRLSTPCVRRGGLRSLRMAVYWLLESQFQAGARVEAVAESIA